jgi:hypothetical protein
MNVAIVFCEGHSGHFLRAVILNHPSSVAAMRISDQLDNSCNGLSIQLTHNVHDTLGSDCVLRILPTRNIYNAIYNIFMKKILIEEFPAIDLANWVDDPVFWYDKCYYHIQEYYHRIHNDISTNTIQHVIDFDQLTNLEYLTDLLHQYFHLEFTDNRRALVAKYSELQLQINLEDDSTVDMQDILAPVTDHMLLQNPWFWAYAVFKFEHNNNLTEQHRLWSVNNFKIPQTRNDLLQYQFLKQLKSNK